LSPLTPFAPLFSFFGDQGSFFLLSTLLCGVDFGLLLSFSFIQTHPTPLTSKKQGTMTFIRWRGSNFVAENFPDM